MRVTERYNKKYLVFIPHSWLKVHKTLIISWESFILHNKPLSIVCEFMLMRSLLEDGNWLPEESAMWLEGWSFQPCSLDLRGFPGGSDGKESAWNVGDLGSILGLGRSSGEGHSNPLQCSYLDNPHGQRSLAGHSPWGHKESNTAERLTHSQIIQ